MRFGYLGATLLAVAMSTAAMAQNANTTRPASAMGEWQASKLIHMNVYNAQNEKIGDIKELMLNKAGKIDTVAVAVGGFLGMAEHDVAVKYDELKWVDEPVASTTSSNAKPASTTGTGQTSATKEKRNYPDHAVLNATKDQLKAMPQFDYNK